MKGFQYLLGNETALSLKYHYSELVPLREGSVTLRMLSAPTSRSWRCVSIFFWDSLSFQRQDRKWFICKPTHISLLQMNFQNTSENLEGPIQSLQC